MPSEAKHRERTATDGEVTDFGIEVPGGARIKAATVRVKYDAGDIARCPTLLFIKSPEAGESTINLHLAEGHIFNTTRGTRAPLTFSESVYWSGDIPIPESSLEAAVRAAVTNESGANFVVTLSVVWENDQSN